ncbi:hypothetical protein Trisim1_007286 [Trichoderma cf. simile WF8]|uniref:SSCRP protein n=1 Tax=Trichoderma guizhouense TaxID=1491466 RepID=A0A1T3CXW7_9HYPO|nr:hypothetical protein A0O28_0095020 [Trichoderma guizhouense]
MRISQGPLALAMVAGSVLAAPAQSINSEIAHDDAYIPPIGTSPWFLPWRRDESSVDQTEDVSTLPGISPWFLPWRRDESSVDQTEDVSAPPGIGLWFLPWRRNKGRTEQTEDMSA